MEGCGILGTVSLNHLLTFFVAHFFLLRAEAVRRIPHTWDVIKYYAMVDPCTLSIINR